jgi:hypothetical protein
VGQLRVDTQLTAGLTGEGMSQPFHKVIEGMIEQYAAVDSTHLEASVFGAPGEITKLAPNDALRLSLKLIQGLKEAVVRLAEEIEVLKGEG